LSPFLATLVNGNFKKLETEAGTVPFKIQGEEFDQMYILVDGIYPRYSRFVRGITVPVTQEQKTYTSWQEGARKDVERSYGVMQAKFQWIDRPIHMHNQEAIALRVASCLIMHNMCVSDRVMDGDCRATYKPDNSHVRPKTKVANPADLLAIQGPTDPADRAQVCIRNAPACVKKLLTERDEWHRLDNTYEHARLMKALLEQSNTESAKKLRKRKKGT
jgi:hypothetical protein